MNFTVYLWDGYVTDVLKRGSFGNWYWQRHLNHTKLLGNTHLNSRVSMRSPHVPKTLKCCQLKSDQTIVGILITNTFTILSSSWPCIGCTILNSFFSANTKCIKAKNINKRHASRSSRSKLLDSSTYVPREGWRKHIASKLKSGTLVVETPRKTVEIPWMN